DPSNDVCPDYTSDDFANMRAAMAAGGMTEERVLEVMRQSWRADHDRRLAAWNAQVQEDLQRAEEANQERREREEEQLAEARKVEEEEQRALEKKKPRLAKVVDGQAPPTQMCQHISEYAREKLAKYAMVELDYFTPKARQQAEAQARNSTLDAITVTQSDVGYTLTQGTAHKPLKGIRRDADLPYTEMLIAWPAFIIEIGNLPTWDKKHVAQYGQFFLHIMGLEDCQDHIGQLAIMRYIEEIRLDWHESIIAKNVSDTAFDISKWRQDR
ncbi:hypothetical protein DAEQUDRAFT_641203, partial [Daedalea quercina L-15889]